MFRIFLLPFYLMAYMARHPRMGLLICVGFVLFVIFYPTAAK